MVQTDACIYVEGGVNLPNGSFKRNITLTLDDVNKFRFRYDNTGVYITAYRYSSPDAEERLLMADFYLDFDDVALTEGTHPEEAYGRIKMDALYALAYLDAIFGIKAEQVSIFFSGQKGVHITVPAAIMGVEPNTKLNLIFRLIAEDISKLCPNKTVDLKIYDARRLFRLVNSRHQKSGLYKIPLTVEELKSRTLADIRKMAEDPRVLPQAAAITNARARTAFQGYIQRFGVPVKKKVREGPLQPLRVTPPCVERLLNDPVPDGQRNNTACALASFLKQQGMAEEEIRSRLVQWNDERCTPPMPDRDVEIVLSSILRDNRAYKYGCSMLSSLAPCDKGRCPLFNRR